MCWPRRVLEQRGRRDRWATVGGGLVGDQGADRSGKEVFADLAHDANETLDHRIEHGPLAVGAVGAEPRPSR